MSPAAWLSIAFLALPLCVAPVRAEAPANPETPPSAEAPATAGAPTSDSSAAIAREGVADSTASLAPASREIGDSLFTALTREFRHQVVAAVYYHGRRYEVADPKILREGFGYRRVTTPGKVRPGEVPASIPWAEVDSLLLRRTEATGLGTGAAVMGGLLGGLYGYSVGGTDNPGTAPFLAIVAGAAGAVLGFLAGGFVGGWFQGWQQVYPHVTPQPERGKPTKWRGQG
jgi:hypothetical protein